jgi:hypothetical protein
VDNQWGATARPPAAAPKPLPPPLSLNPPL